MPATTNRSLVLPFVLPYVAYVGIASIPADWLARDWNYIARIAIAGGALVWAWPRLLPLRGPGSLRLSIAAGAVAGVVGAALWIALMTPFAGEAQAWTPQEWWLRVGAAVLIVPIFEEQLMRGYLLRLGTQIGMARKRKEKDPFGVAFEQQSVFDLAPGRVNTFGVVTSIALFTIGHAIIEYPAAIVYGGLMVWLYVWRRDLIGCVIAHAVTNLLLALWVVGTGAWGLW